jgi:hypothetical protein
VPSSNHGRALKSLARGLVYGSVSLLVIAIAAVTVSYARSSAEPVAREAGAPIKTSEPLPTAVPLPSMTPFPSPAPLVAIGRSDIIDTAVSFYGPWVLPEDAHASYPSAAAAHHATTTASWDDPGQWAQPMAAREQTATRHESSSEPEVSGSDGPSPAPTTITVTPVAPTLAPVAPAPEPTLAPVLVVPTTPAPLPSAPALPLPAPSPTLVPLLP